MSDLADLSAAQSAGYTVTRCDKAAGAHSPRYTTVLEKPIVGDVGQSGSMLRAYGESDSSSGAADTQALAALNAQRAYRYGGTGSNGGVLTVDVS
jgi:hypothetical protein